MWSCAFSFVVDDGTLVVASDTWRHHDGGDVGGIHKAVGWSVSRDSLARNTVVVVLDAVVVVLDAVVVVVAVAVVGVVSDCVGSPSFSPTPTNTNTTTNL